MEIVTSKSRKEPVPKAGEYRWTNIAIVGLDKTTQKPYTAFPDISQGVKKPEPITH